MVRVKICGITNKRDALECVAAGAHALGFIFFEKSPRYVSPQEAREIILALPPFVSKVGVFVNEKPEVIKDVVHECMLDFVQLHGEEGFDVCKLFPHKVIKAFRVKDESVFQTIKGYEPYVKAVLLDAWSRGTYGGTGKSFDWSLAKKAVLALDLPVILAGGLNPQNISQAVREVSPYAVDVSSGLEESPGKKDHRLIKDFFNKLRQEF